METYLPGNHVTLLCNGADFFPALEAAINAATREIYLESYIYTCDITGERISKALGQAAQRGVRVHVLIDGFGSAEFKDCGLEKLEKTGVTVMFYRPKMTTWRFKRSRLRRLHRKLCVVDGKTAFVGGINIIDDMDVPRSLGPRIDYAVQIKGALVTSIQKNMQKLWQRIAWLHFKLPISLPKLPKRKKPPATQVNVGNIAAAFVVRDNGLHRSDIEEMYLDRIQSAQHEILIANAYFLPGRKFRNALVNAARRGVRVRLLLQGLREYRVLVAMQACYSYFLANGIEIYEYRKSFMHSKVAVIDETWATVGSSNIDPFSLLMAREANVAILDSAFAIHLKQQIENNIAQGAVQIDIQNWKDHRKLPQRILSWIGFGLVRLGMGVFGFPTEHKDNTPNHNAN